MTLPFSTEVFFALFAQYNQAICPAPVIAYGLGIACLGLAIFPRAWSDRAISAVLALAWIWIGGVYHIGYFYQINFLAPVYGAFFILQGFLLAWTGAARGQVAFRFRPDIFGWLGMAAAVFAVAVYPAIGWLAGHAWPAAPVFGVAPGPTTIFTMGLLVMGAGRTPRHLVVIPVLWSLVGGTAAWLLDLPQDAALPVAGIGGLLLILWKNRRIQRAGSLAP